MPDGIIGLVQEGDMIEIKSFESSIQLNILIVELEKREQSWKAPQSQNIPVEFWQNTQQL